jgi:4'-phosphopantetheinyl transferase
MHAILLHHAPLPAALDEQRLDLWIRALAPDKAARVLRLRRPELRLATVLGVALLQDCARAAGLSPPRAIDLLFPAHGKPAWPSGPDFSISHAGGWVACALAPPGVQVGLDIEPEGAAEVAVLRLVAEEGELHAYERAGLTATDLWTAKEAVVKLTGEGAAAARRARVDLEAAELAGRLSA